MGVAASAVPVTQQAPALQLTGLLKRFGGMTAVDHIDLAVPQGSFFGLVGPTCAGRGVPALDITQVNTCIISG